MLPAGHRLRSGREFRLTTRRGRRAGTPTVVVHGREATDVSTQVGFVVSRRVGSAVARNRVKRRLRHLMATRLTRLPAGSRVVVRALPSAAGASGAELGRDLDKALRRLSDSGGVRR